MSTIDMKQAINKVVEGESLTKSEARDVMRTIMDGEGTAAQKDLAP